MLWRSAPLEIMMRSNAPITAILALAALSLSPATLLAKPTAHHPAHKTAVCHTSTTKKRAHKPADAQAATACSGDTETSTRTKRRKHHPQQEETADPPIINPPRTPASTQDLPGRRRLCARKATSADFLRAAGQPEPQDTAPVHRRSLDHYRRRYPTRSRASLDQTTPWPSPPPWSAWLAAPPPRGRSLRASRRPRQPRSSCPRSTTSAAASSCPRHSKARTRSFCARTRSPTATASIASATTTICWTCATRTFSSPSPASSVAAGR